MKKCKFYGHLQDFQTNRVLSAGLFRLVFVHHLYVCVVCMCHQFFKSLLLPQFSSDFLKILSEGSPGGSPSGLCFVWWFTNIFYFGRIFCKFYAHLQDFYIIYYHAPMGMTCFEQNPFNEWAISFPVQTKVGFSSSF